MGANPTMTQNLTKILAQILSLSLNLNPRLGLSLSPSLSLIVSASLVLCVALAIPITTLSPRYYFWAIDSPGAPIGSVWVSQRTQS